MLNLLPPITDIISVSDSSHCTIRLWTL